MMKKHAYDQFIETLTMAVRSQKPWPDFPKGLTLDEAYALLPDVAERVCDAYSPGLKAGLTNTDFQAFFGLDNALLGYLYDWGACVPGVTLGFRQNAQIECELGIIVNADGLPVSVGPAIEFVAVNFSNPEDFTPANLVLSSLGADRFVSGEHQSWQDVDFSMLRDSAIRLYRNEEPVLETSAFASLDGPETAVSWCVEEARKRGLGLRDNTLIITGTCGEAVPFLPGEYRVDYGPLGSLTFSIADQS